MADLATSRPSIGPDLSHAKGRKVIVQHKTFGLFPFQKVKSLGVIPRPKRGHRKTLRLAACKERGTMRPRQNADLAGNLADFSLTTSVRSFPLHKNQLPHSLFFQILKNPLHKRSAKAFRFFVTLSQPFFFILFFS